MVLGVDPGTRRTGLALVVDSGPDGLRLPLAVAVPGAQASEMLRGLHTWDVAVVEVPTVRTGGRTPASHLLRLSAVAWELVGLLRAQGAPVVPTPAGRWCALPKATRHARIARRAWVPGTVLPRSPDALDAIGLALWRIDGMP